MMKIRDLKKFYLLLDKLEVYSFKSGLYAFDKVCRDITEKEIRDTKKQLVKMFLD